jgi:hypothetical protein
LGGSQHKEHARGGPPLQKADNLLLAARASQIQREVHFNPGLAVVCASEEQLLDNWELWPVTFWD